jgi:hypothetical protein
MAEGVADQRFVDPLPFLITRVTGSDRGLRGLWTPRWTPEVDPGGQRDAAGIETVFNAVRWAKPRAPDGMREVADGGKTPEEELRPRSAIFVYPDLRP